MNPVSVFEGQGWVQIGELLIAFVLSAAVGFERNLRGKSAGLRTQAIVGTSSALFLLISKYGFMDVLSDHIVLDPSRVAAQIVSGIGFLGAGLILTRRGTVRGLTTAASVWETAAIGMAAGAGLWLLALVVTALHFVIAFGLSAVAGRFTPGSESAVLLEVTYADGRGLLREVLRSITAAGWTVSRAEAGEEPDGIVALQLTVRGPRNPERLLAAVIAIDGVRGAQALPDADAD